MLFRYLSVSILLLFTGLIDLRAQTMDYSKEWKKVEAAEQKGLTQTALAAVNQIFALAAQSGNDPQLIKAVIKRLVYENALAEDDHINRQLSFLDSLIKASRAPRRNILESIYAEMLTGYRNNNRYRLYDRTKLANEESADIKTWSADKLHQTIALYYRASLQNEESLKKTMVADFEAIIEKGNSRTLRPTLFDLLAHRALEYFSDEETGITRPSYKFKLDGEAGFLPASEFIKSSFTTKDSTSNHVWALKLYQRLLSFHLQDANPEALLDVDLSRLEFVYQHSTSVNKEEFYEKALLNLEKNFPNADGAARAMFLRASLYHTNGSEYHPITNPSPQFDWKKALNLCDSILQRFPKSEAAVHAYNLRLHILNPELQVETESVNIPAQAFRSLVKYRNMQTIHFRVIEFSRKELLRWNHADDDRKTWGAIADKKAIKSWSIALPDPGDYQEHAAEVKVDGLPAGMYVLLASKDADFRLQENVLARQVIYVSNISYIMNRRDAMFVLHRDSGEPLAGVNVQSWTRKYNYTCREYEEEKADSYKSDKDGRVVTSNKKSEQVYYQFNYLKEELFTDDLEYSHNYNGQEQPEKTQAFLFTDRSIYRPGQILYFKGLIVNGSRDTDRNRFAKPSVKTTVQLFNANQQKVGEVTVTTNEYGSYNGSFVLPQSGLTGQFMLMDSLNNGSTWIRVEEYKRPKFSVEIQKPETAYKLNEVVTVTGTAKAYAGNSIASAKVVYRVVRKARYPMWWWEGGFGKSWPPGRREEMEIENGEAETKDDGTFEIKFTAIPDETTDRKYQPIFSYEVSADVTDINGETRSGSTNVSIGYHPIEISIAGEEELLPDSLGSLRVFTKNIDGGFEKTRLRVQLQKLKEPGRIFRKRYWEQPDQFTMTEMEYRREFPYDVYKNEDDPKQWEVSSTLREFTDSSHADGVISWTSATLEPGWYKVIAVTASKDSGEVRAEKIIYISSVASQKPLQVTVSKKELQPGEKAGYKVMTAFEKIWLIETTSRINNNRNYRQPVVSSVKPYENQLMVAEEDRGGINLDFIFVKHNRVYNSEQSLAIPWSNKDLDIRYETFRDKTLPGSTEKWKINISGPKADKVAAEALVTMYDASLDQFYKQEWPSMKNLWPVLNLEQIWSWPTFDVAHAAKRNTAGGNMKDLKEKLYDRLLSLPFSRYYRLAYDALIVSTKDREVMLSGNAASQSLRRDASVADEGSKIAYKDKEEESSNTAESPQNSTVRKDFRETAFFVPDLRTDANGNIEFSFTMPEALTTWKMRTLAHTKDLASLYSEKTVITQKQLMVQPNAPRFFREGDQIELVAKVVNLSDKEVTGTAELELFDATTNKPVDGWFKNVFPTQYFTVGAGKSMAVKFPMEIPFNYNSALGWRIKAITNDKSFSDGEEQIMPVLTNRMLVTETLPLNLRNETKKTFRFEKLIKSAGSATLTHQQLTVEYSSNPAWYAVQALLYLMEYPYECSEQSFNRYYANSLASSILSNKPMIKAVFDKWRSSTTDSAAVISNLSKNQELKTALLEETPWVLDAQSETAQKKNIAILFDLNRLTAEQSSGLQKLKDMQTPNGGFPWFKGGRDHEYITAYILCGIGHLKKLNVINRADKGLIDDIAEKGLRYLDERIREQYDRLLKSKPAKNVNNLDPYIIQYLYMRSFFDGDAIPSKSEKAVAYYTSQAKKHWLSQSKYMQAMIALALHRKQDINTANAILRSLKENAINDPELGMYFKEFERGGYYWHTAPVEAQSMMIEAFSEIQKDKTVVDDLKTWLLKQKQTRSWRSTKATAEACYALLLNGSDWLINSNPVNIELGNIRVNSSEENTEAGTGYFKKTFPADKVKSEMGNITVSRLKDSTAGSIGTSWGAVYWQYFEDLDKITAAETGLKLNKKLFIETNSDNGPVLKAINDGDALHIGDKIKIRVELRVDRDLEFVHMKDMRSSGMEPVNVLSSYRWQGGLGYYESTRDASTNFFFDWLPRGTYVFEYPVFLTHAGNFSNGVTSIQCMYAPEFSSHSEGIRINVSAK